LLLSVLLIPGLIGWEKNPSTGKYSIQEITQFFDHKKTFPGRRHQDKLSQVLKTQKTTLKARLKAVNHLNKIFLCPNSYPVILTHDPPDD